jgi:peptidoglycan/xylan/chitin deacetylase (PgdA/CDA1 family)
MILILGDGMMKMERRFFMRAFIAGIMGVLLAFSMLVPNAQSFQVRHHARSVHSHVVVMERAIRKIIKNDDSPFLARPHIDSQWLSRQVLNNPRLILSVYRQMKDEEQQLKDSLVNQPRVIDPNRPMVALTFDDGPWPTTEKVYASLKKYNVVATFFVIGMYVNRRSDMLKKLVDAGNEIGNHSWSHLNFREISYEEVVSQVVRSDAAIERAIGVKPKFVRPPMGLFDNKARNAIGDRQIAMWSIDTLDWKHKDWQKTMASIVGHVQDGDIILIHDSVDSTANNIEELIIYLIEEGYQLVTLSELVEYRNVDQKVVRYARP